MRGGGDRVRRGGTSLVEALVGVAVILAALIVAYQISHQLFGGTSRHNLVSMTRRSFIQKDAKVGLRRLIYRLREAIQVLEPRPGRSGEELVVRDLTNRRLRLRRDPAEKRLVSEQFVNGAWQLETAPVDVATQSGSLPASFPVYMANCNSVTFTVPAPDCVVVQLSVAADEQIGSFMTTVKLRNSRLAY